MTGSAPRGRGGPRWAPPAALLAILAAGCGSGALGGPSVRDGSSDAPAEDADSLAPSCGGTVQAAGTLSGQPFSAEYVFAFYESGHCASTLWLSIADSERADALRFELPLFPDAAGSFVGSRVVRGAAYRPAVPSNGAISADVEVLSSPSADDARTAPTAAPVVGTFTIDNSNVSVTGSFSTPVCAFQICS